MAPRVVVVGAGPSGLRTVQALRRSGGPAHITLVGAEPYPCYQRPPLSKSLLTQEEDPTQPPVIDVDYTELDVDLRLATRAVSLDTEHGTVSLSDGSTLTWDRLVVATGVRPCIPAAWSSRDGIHTLRSFDDLNHIRQAWRGARRVAVIGAGVLGCEVAASARHCGLEVELVDTLDVPMKRVVGAEVGRMVAEMHQRRGVSLHLGRGVSSISQGHTVELDDRTVLDVDDIVVAVGTEARSEWLADSGVDLDAGVVVDEYGESSVPGVFAVGDAAARPNPDGTTSRQEHWTHAGESAEAVAANLLHPRGDRVALETLPYAWSDQWDIKIQTLGVVTADLVLCDVGHESSSLFGLYSEDGRVVGAVGWNRVPQVMRMRRPIVERWAIAEALELIDIPNSPPATSRRPAAQRGARPTRSAPMQAHEGAN